MSRGPWKKHKTHCQRCGSHARHIGTRENGVRRYKCVSCGNAFKLAPGESAPELAVMREAIPDRPLTVAGRIQIGRGFNWNAGA